MTEAIIFDLNGTLLDMSVLDPYFVRLFGSAEARQIWFDQLQLLWHTANATNRFRTFDDLAKASLQMVGQRTGISVEPTVVKALLNALTTVPLFPDVVKAISMLRGHKVKLAVLTNSSKAAAKRQVKSAGIVALFDRVMSAESVKRYKPAVEPYLFALKKLRTPPHRTLLVTAHGWDIAGGKAAGLRTTFIRRPGEMLTPGEIVPDLSAGDLIEAASQLIPERSGVR